MPFFADQMELTQAELNAQGGRREVQSWLLEELWNGDATRLKDGHRYVIQISRPAPIAIEGPEEKLSVTVMIRWWHAEPQHAGMGEIVYGDILRPVFAGTDANGMPLLPNENSIAASGSRRFEPHPEGWIRVH
jgi:hypothetical protein